MNTDLATIPDVEPITNLRRGRTAADVDLSLAVLASTAGNAGQAEELLKTSTRARAATLTAWANRYPRRYALACNRYAREIEEHVVSGAREVAVQAQEATRAAVALELRRIEAEDVKDAAGSARNMATVFGITVDKLMVLTGRPAHIVEHQTPDAVLAGLTELGKTSGFVDSTAEEIQEATHA